MLIFNEYNKIFLLLAVYFSRFWAVLVIGVLSFRFIQWFRSVRSASLLVYALVFGAVLFLFLVTIPLLTEQFSNQFELIYPRDYTTVILTVLVPSRSIAFIYGLTNYVLPLMIIFSWILTVSLLKPYSVKISKKIFWTVVSVPLLYQFFSFAVRDAGLITDPAFFGLIYSKQFQFLFAISYQVSGLLFGMAFLNIARKMKRRPIRRYLIISSVGIVSLFSSVQPGMPFYAAYPPFGLVTLVFLGVSSYMLLVGMLGIAANVSRDAELRREIYKGLEVDSDMLKNIGMAETQLEIEKRVTLLADKTRMSGEMSAHVDPSIEDVKSMVEEIMNELHPKGRDDGH
jgi:hypothetical protein